MKSISKSYGLKAVVNDVSITLPRGKITSFIGPNGAGKSTLLSIISRLMSADKGEVLIDGQKVNQKKSRELAKKMAILKQSNHLNVRLSVQDLVCFGRFPYSQGKLGKEDLVLVNKAIRYMELEDLKNCYLDQLSGGQRQRAFIAMTIVQDTDYILLDEPLNNLDMKHSVQIMKVLRNLAEELNKAIIIVIHDINFASVYSDYIVALKDGRVEAQGTVNEMITSPILKKVYGMDISIQEINNHKICLYFN